MARKSIYPPSVTPGIPRLSSKPDGWIETTFGEVLQVVQRRAKVADDAEYQLVNVKRSRGGVVARGRLLGRQVLTKTQFYIHTDDFLISKRQIIHGACGIVPAPLDGGLVSNEYATLRVKDGLSLDFLRYYVHTVYFQQTCLRASVGVDVEKMLFRLPEWLTYRLHLPSVGEQQKIAALLGTWDQAIALAEDRLMAARTRKRALMLALLPGRLRFPDCVQSGAFRQSALGVYPEEWSVRRLADIAQVRFSNVDKKIIPGERKVRLCNYTNVFRKDYIDDQSVFMTGSATEAEIDSFSLRRGDVVLTKDSETREEIAEAAVVSIDAPDLVCGYHLAVLRPYKDSVSGFYLKEALRSPYVHNQFVRSANGITRYGVPLSAVENVLVPIPAVQEQARIVGFLAECDRELTLLARKRDALQDQRRGLMQHLLTGRVRLKA